MKKITVLFLASIVFATIIFTSCNQEGKTEAKEVTATTGPILHDALKNYSYQVFRSDTSNFLIAYKTDGINMSNSPLVTEGYVLEYSGTDQAKLKVSTSGTIGTVLESTGGSDAKTRNDLKIDTVMFPKDLKIASNSNGVITIDGVEAKKGSTPIKLARVIFIVNDEEGIVIGYAKQDDVSK